MVAPNWLGDAVMAIPFLRAIQAARPGEKLTVLAKRGPGAILGALPAVDVIERRSSVLADAIAIRRRRFTDAWLLPNSFRSAVAPFLAGIPERIGFATDRRTALLSRALPPPPGTAHQLRDYDSLLEARGISPDLAPPRIPLPERSAALASDALLAARLPPGESVMLAPGAAFAWTKRWPTAHWGRLAALLRESGVASAFVIGPGEEAIAAEAVLAAAFAVPVLGAHLDPPALAALLALARVVVANDSGPMHLAGAVGTPVVALFGPTDPGRTAPSGSPARVLDRYVFCSPCFLKECPYAHECMVEITPEQLKRVLDEVMESREFRGES
ncbi:MAG: lipopolysaccharide heptosyltransferase II [Acidobacteria bacterium]|nr:lipopolysaccharide heptosyltransferase II [Acidobacteriota bacterium]MCA1611772.1 lipopolysaccharide heptosyltransferase II [Acidobacteriota bacterium]MCA1617427.1 lipopolysaccharide heptosyltransferase II [Acidobacteriota bacterium]